MGEPVQQNTARTVAVQRGRAVERDVTRRRRELWQRLLEGTLSARDGREFIADVLLGDVGVFKEIDLTLPPNELAARLARNNLGVRWIRNDIARFPKHYRQLQEEAIERDDARRQAREAINAAPRGEEIE